MLISFTSDPTSGTMRGRRPPAACRSSSIALSGLRSLSSWFKCLASEFLLAVLVCSCQGAQDLFLRIVILATGDTQTGLPDEIRSDHGAVVTEEAEVFPVRHCLCPVYTGPWHQAAGCVCWSGCYRPDFPYLSGSSSTRFRSSRQSRSSYSPSSRTWKRKVSSSKSFPSFCQETLRPTFPKYSPMERL